MIELKEHKVYNLLRNKYKRVGIDYVILCIEEIYTGAETHKKAVIEAFKILNNRYDYIEITIETEKMDCSVSSIEDLLSLPESDYYDTRPKGNRYFSIPTPLTYWFAFLEPPYGVTYLKDDFISFNNILFPNKNDTEVYRWNNTFSNYFDEGKEWWGTGLWSVYDEKTGIMVIIGASLTD